MRRLTTVPILILLLASCHHEDAEPPGYHEAAAKQAATSATSATAPSTTLARTASGPASEETSVSVKRADGAELLTINEHANGNIEIAFVATGGAKRMLRGNKRESGKRKYSVDNGPVMFEVKPGDDLGFKLRLADGKLLWKVKVAAEKIKISNNEENQNPFELKTRENNRFKVVAPGDRELGNVRDGAVEDASGKALFNTTSKKPSAGFGALLLSDIPEIERYILIGEIVGRGR
jgi:hypothetical protein